MNQDIEILRLLAKKDKEIEKLYNKLIYQLSKVSLNITKIREGAFFSFDDYPELKAKVDDVLNTYSEEQQVAIVNGINSAIKTSFKVNEAQIGKFSRYSNQAITDMRKTAAEAFIESRMKPEEGLSLSQKVWNYTRQAKAEFEAGMSEILEDGISVGMSAEELGRKLRDKLKHPDMVYRRYHLKKMTAKGKKDVVEWRRKVVDSEGRVRYVKEDLEKVGRGVYRSSRKNALRLTATEINMAYRYADYVRWNSEPFVIGFRIQLSENHTLNGKPFHDMCDDLVGIYPKSFKWSGWHPKCRCIATSILVNEEEMEKISELPDEEYQNYHSPNLVKKMPKAYDEYVAKEKDRILASMDRGTAPYWIRDNYKGGDIRKKFVWETGKRVKTKAEKEEIQRRWDERRERYESIIRLAKSLYNEAKEYPSINTSNLQWLTTRRKYHLLSDEIRSVQRTVKRIEDDRKSIGKSFTQGNLQKLYENLKSDKNYTDVRINSIGGVKATHVNHIVHSSRKERTYFELTSTQLEKKCQQILFENGYTCVLENEMIFDAVTKQQRTQLDTVTNGIAMDIRAITENNKNTIKNAIKSKKKQLKKYNELHETNSDCLILYFHKAEYYDENQIEASIGGNLKKVICVFSNGRIKVLK